MAINDQNLFKIGLLEDEEFVFLNWEILAESSSIPCKIEWYETPDKLMSSLDQLDLVIVDRRLGDLDVFESGTVETLYQAFNGPLVLSSLSNPTKDEKKFFQKVLHNKRPTSIEVLHKLFTSFQTDNAQSSEEI